MKKTALVIGATGGFGGAVARELLTRGYSVRALLRPGGRSLGSDLAGVEVVTGSVHDAVAMQRAARRANFIVHGYNAPYARWDPEMLDAGEVVAEAAERSGARIVLPGNVYGLGPDFSAPLAESASRVAPTRKGELRNSLEARLEAATARGAQLLIVRAGDYLGPRASSTWFGEMTRPALQGGAILDPAAPGVPHEWAYLPDLARATVDLMDRSAELAANAIFHFSGYQVTSAELIAAIQDALPAPRRVRRLPWWGLRVAATVSRFWREVVEMKYLWDEPVLLDDTKLRTVLGRNPHVTPLALAVRETLAGADRGVARAA